MSREKEIFEEITYKGACRRCALRYLTPEQEYDKNLVSFECPNTTLVNLGVLSPCEEFESPIKKRKENPCCICLGILQDDFITESLQPENAIEAMEYLHPDFLLYATFPACVHLRDHSMYLHLKRTFPDFFQDRNNMKLNHAWRLSIEPQLARILNKSFSRYSRLKLHFYTEYCLDDEETAVIKDFVKDHDNLSKHYISSFIESIPDSQFSELVQIPPNVPLYSVTFKQVKVFSDYLYLIGNYCKYSRTLPQRQVRDIDHKNATSIEAILFDAVFKVLGCCDVVFKASNFDETDMRVVGTGRSFQLQINNPRFGNITPEQCHQIQQVVNESRVLQVNQLKTAEKKDFNCIAASEQTNPRSYKVLCIVYECRNIDHCVNAINMYQTITVHQKTPIKLMYQRQIASKKKQIYHIRAKKLRDNLIELDLVTESGLSVYEFVNGDLGRTSPSLSEIINGKVDVLAMDLVALKAFLPCALEEHEVDI